MRRYEHGGDIYGNDGVSLDFSVNTNPLGMPKNVRQALIVSVDMFDRLREENDKLKKEILALDSKIMRLEGKLEQINQLSA